MIQSVDDFAAVYREDEDVVIRKGDLRALLDLATGSLDFGSGFWDEEQAGCARRIAALLNVAPEAVTPLNLLCHFEGHKQGHALIDQISHLDRCCIQWAGTASVASWRGEIERIESAISRGADCFCKNCTSLLSATGEVMGRL